MLRGRHHTFAYTVAPTGLPSAPPKRPAPLVSLTLHVLIVLLGPTRHRSTPPLLFTLNLLPAPPYPPSGELAHVTDGANTGDAPNSETTEKEIENDLDEQKEPSGLTMEDTKEMSLDETKEACKTMVDECKCGDFPTKKTGSFGLTYRCHGGTCCMLKMGRCKRIRQPLLIQIGERSQTHTHEAASVGDTGGPDPLRLSDVTSLKNNKRAAAKALSAKKVVKILIPGAPLVKSGEGAPTMTAAYADVVSAHESDYEEEECVKTRFCSDDTFCDDTDNFVTAVDDDGDVNGWSGDPAVAPFEGRGDIVILDADSAETTSLVLKPGQVWRSEGEGGSGGAGGQCRLVLGMNAINKQRSDFPTWFRTCSATANKECKVVSCLMIAKQTAIPAANQLTESDEYVD